MVNLHKSKNAVICGVCGGIAETFNLDPTLVRLIAALLLLAAAPGVLLLYIVLCIILPEGDGPAKGRPDVVETVETEPGRYVKKESLAPHTSKWLGIFLILLGLYWGLKNLSHFFPFLDYWFNLASRIAVPVLLIAAGFWFYLREK